MATTIIYAIGIALVAILAWMIFGQKKKGLGGVYTVPILRKGYEILVYSGGIVKISGSMPIDARHTIFYFTGDQKGSISYANSNILTKVSQNGTVIHYAKSDLDNMIHENTPMDYWRANEVAALRLDKEYLEDRAKDDALSIVDALLRKTPPMNQQGGQEGK